MRTFLFSAIGIITILALFLVPVEVDATSGIPGSPRFGYGARLHIPSPQTETAILTADSVALDWVAIDFDWASLWPDPNSAIHWNSLDQVIHLVNEHQISVLISITDPPDWAVTSAGPDQDLTVDIVSRLMERYPQTVLALEIFPGPNTTQGWGGLPNPEVYASLLAAVYETAQKTNPQVTVVAGGLASGRPATPSDIDDLTFLQSLYAAGAAPTMPVVGLRLTEIGTVPTLAPQDDEKLTIRHYEAVRNVMLQNNHATGLIWVTGFSWDQDAISAPQDQAIWLKQAYLMMRAQLYIGVAFFQNLNAPEPREIGNSLVQSGLDFHPGTAGLREIIAFEYSQQTATFTFNSLKNSKHELNNKHLRLGKNP